jgi:hypothetical protein
VRDLQRLVGTWTVSGGARGEVTFEWWTAGITSRSYDTAGDTPDDVYGLSGDVLTIWDGERGSPVLRSLTKACT